MLDYNPHTFKVNGIDDNGFDINVPGTYTVTYEVSHFMYFDYSWYVNTTVNVIDRIHLIQDCILHQITHR